jgi:hypothetical protein
MRCVPIDNTTRSMVLVGYATAPVTVDGELAEYGATSTEIPVSAGAAAATFRLLWNEQALFVGVLVQDRDLWAPGKGRDSAELNRSDGVEVLLDPAWDRVTPPNSDDREVIITAAADLADAQGAAAKADTLLNFDPSFVVAVDGTVDAGNDDDQGYRVEVALPMAQLSSAPKSGVVFGLDLVLNNTKGDGSQVTRDWAGLTDYGASDRWYAVMLVGPYDRTVARSGDCAAMPWRDLSWLLCVAAVVGVWRSRQRSPQRG